MTYNRGYPADVTAGEAIAIRYRPVIRAREVFRMSLMKRRTLTEKQKAAAQANGGHSRGPLTPEGRERIRAANLRHGLHSQAETPVVTAFGERPEDFERLRQGYYDSWLPADAEQEEWVERLVEVTWRLQRIERLQEELSIQRHIELFGGEKRTDSPVADEAYPDLLWRIEGSQPLANLSD
jgi:hypothetical protein